MRIIKIIDYFKNKLFAGLKVPKQYFGETDDSTGFNGGTSLSIISSRYAKTVKRIQSTVIQMLTDAINILLIDRGLDSYVNKFDLHMQAPVTQEELDKRDSLSSEIAITDDVTARISVFLRAARVALSLQSSSYQRRENPLKTPVEFEALKENSTKIPMGA